MQDDHNAPRRPFGERNAQERNQPFGARPPIRRSDNGGSHADESSSWESDSLEVDEKDQDRTLSPFSARPPAYIEPTSPYYERTQTSIDEMMQELDDDDSAEDDEAEPSISDEPDHAPNVIKVRSQWRRGMTDSGILKPKDAPTFESFPEQDEKEAEAARVRETAQQRAQIALQIRVIFQSIVVMFLTAGVFATLFTWWTPNTFLPAASRASLEVALATQTAPVVSFLPTLTPAAAVGAGGPAAGGTPLGTVGIVSGHRGLHRDTGLPDPGATCADGTNEQAVVENVANATAELLRGQGYQVDIFDEFDPRLSGYSANAMVSIHADSCEYINDVATGFKVASFSASTTPDLDSRLVGCMIQHYAETTGMGFHPSVTYDMTEYHNFRELAVDTPGAIIEIGFLYLDREMLTEHADVVALGVARGVMCYLRNDPINPENIATPSAVPAEIP